MTELMEYEAEQVAAANASGKKPIVFVHGLWLLPSSWDRWAEYFEAAGFSTVTAGWPDDPDAPRSSRACAGFAPKRVVRVLVDEPASCGPAHFLESLTPRCDHDCLWSSGTVRVHNEDAVEPEAPGFVRVSRRADVCDLRPVGRPHWAVTTRERGRGDRARPPCRLSACKCEQRDTDRSHDRSAGSHAPSPSS
jgi:hypothetical protein